MFGLKIHETKGKPKQKRPILVGSALWGLLLVIVWIKNIGFSSESLMAERTGLEPATPGVTGRYSNQLNYRSGTGLVGVTGVEPVTFGL